MRSNRQRQSHCRKGHGKRENEMFHSAASEHVDGGVVNSEGNVPFKCLGMDTDIMGLSRWACLFHGNGV